MQGEVVSNRLNVYDSPSNTATVVGHLLHGDEVEVLSENGQFFEITFESGTAWVLSCYVLESGNYGIVTFPDFNASVKYNTFAYNLVDDNYEITTISVSKDSRVKILSGYDNKKDYTEVYIVNEGRVRVCYILTEAISPDGVDPTIIIAISLTATALGIIFILMGVSFTKKRRKQNS